MFLSLGQLTASIIAVFVSIFAFNTWAAFDQTYDYVVIGGGTAGITIAARLVQNGSRVAIVEAGGYYELKYPLARVPGAAILGIGASPNETTPIDWKFVVRGAPGADYRDIHYPRGKCMGGS